MTTPITHEIRNNIGIIKINNPPVNALSHSVRLGLVDSLQKISDEPNVEAIILIGEGRTFIAGADISEFGKPMNEPDLNTVIFKYENSSKPIIAALHGTPFGGGLEVSMGCHYRIALDSTLLGLPEVKLGLLPGAGGTQRLPRLVGPEKALNMVTTGNPIRAKEALSFGLVDKVVDDDLLDRALTFAEEKSKLGNHPRSRDIEDKISNVDMNIFKKAEDIILKKMRGRKSPLRALKSVELSINLPFDEGLKKERELFKECHDSEESSSLIHMFFSERGASKIPDIPKDIGLREIKSAAVIGCGTMGGGIAMNFANIGMPVKIIENSSEALEKGMSIIKSNYQSTLAKGRLSKKDMEKRISLISGNTDLESIKDADVIIEAVFEEMELKKNLFSKLDKIAKSNAILASNTSTLDIDEIASVTSRPEDVIGTHFFSPANVMKLLELVRGDKTSKEVIATTMRLAKTINKVPVLAGNCDGFIGNRMFHQYIRQAHALAEEGASIVDIDRVIYDFGWAMGPFAVNDLAGNDVGWRIRKRHNKEGKYDNERYTSTVADQLCEKGRFGQKTGRGFYIYGEKTRKRTPDAEVDEMFKRVAAEKGIERRKITDDEILKRLSWSLVNTGCMILEEGFAIRASDIDVTYIYGYGYPSWRGGPMKYAEHIGLDKVLKDIEQFRSAGDGMWPKCNLLEKLANEGGSFSQLKPKTRN